MNSNKWTIIACSNKNNKYLHLKYLRQSNEHNQIIKLNMLENQVTDSHWECDKVIRNWFLSKPDRINNIKYNNIALVEYDVLITQPLPDIKLNNELLCSDKMTTERHSEWQNWQWLFKVNELTAYFGYSVGCMPFSLYFMSKNCLSIWLDKKHDDIYNHPMSGEVRLPTILNRNGVQINKHPSLKQVKFLHRYNLNFDINVPGIYHPVKYSTHNIAKIKQHFYKIPESDKNNKDSSN